MNLNLVHVKTDNTELNRAYYLAVSDLAANIKLFQSGILEEEKPVIIAGYDYSTPWTRDAAINVMNAGFYLMPEVSENTLWAVLRKENGRVLLDGEYWDAIIWVLGAWSLYLGTGDKAFLQKAYEITQDVLAYFEETEFDPQKNLFRGPGVYGDGVAAYPDLYATHADSPVSKFAEECREYCVEQGVGIPMFTLSTNCTYYAAYVLADRMGAELGYEPQYTEKALALKDAVNTHFWMEEQGQYRYLIDPYDTYDAWMEGMGHAYVVLFGVADERRARKVLKNQHITPHGIPCVWPNFERYAKLGEYGRHSGPIWPQIQAFWGDAAAKYERWDLFEHEFFNMTEKANRDGYFAELYHPDTGALYGGIQEYRKQGMKQYRCSKKQTWSATGYLHMIFMNILGMRFEKDGVRFCPYLPEGVTQLQVTDLEIRGRKYQVYLEGKGRKIDCFQINGSDAEYFLPY